MPVTERFDLDTVTWASGERCDTVKLPPLDPARALLEIGFVMDYRLKSVAGTETVIDFSEGDLGDLLDHLLSRIEIRGGGHSLVAALKGSEVRLLARELGTECLGDFLPGYGVEQAATAPGEHTGMVSLRVPFALPDGMTSSFAPKIAQVADLQINAICGSSSASTPFVDQAGTQWYVDSAVIRPYIDVIDTPDEAPRQPICYRADQSTDVSYKAPVANALLFSWLTYDEAGTILTPADHGRTATVELRRDGEVVASGVSCNARSLGLQAEGARRGYAAFHAAGHNRLSQIGVPLVSTPDNPMLAEYAVAGIFSARFDSSGAWPTTRTHLFAYVAPRPGGGDASEVTGPIGYPDGTRVPAALVSFLPLRAAVSVEA